MKSVFDILKEVASTTSHNEKKAILTKHKDNKDLKEVIRLAYDPFINFYIRKIPNYNLLHKKNDSYNLRWGLESLDELSTRTVTGNEAISHLLDVLNALHKEDADVITRVVGRDLRCGFSEGTANKVWPNLIATYPCMLCSQSDEKILAKIKYPAYFQMKLDGMRFNAIVRNGKVEYRSRNGKLIDLFGILDDVFIKMAWNPDCVFDGELLILDDNYKPLPRQIGNGILQRAVKGKGTEKDIENVAAVLWDTISYQSFMKGYEQIGYSIRFDVLNGMIKNRVGDSPRVSIVDSHIVNNLEEAHILYQDYLTAGQEGGILKSFEGPWEDKRSHNQIKFKAEKETDLLCVGFEKGTGKNAYRLGALVLESSDKVIKVSVGSGFTDLDRDTFTEENTVGKIITVKYNTRIKDAKTEQESLFLPIFIELRLDKSEADSSKDIE